jgi:hypothetical protein
MLGTTYIASMYRHFVYLMLTTVFAVLVNQVGKVRFRVG